MHSRTGQEFFDAKRGCGVLRKPVPAGVIRGPTLACITAAMDGWTGLGAQALLAANCPGGDFPLVFFWLAYTSQSRFFFIVSSSKSLIRGRRVSLS